MKIVFKYHLDDENEKKNCFFRISRKKTTQYIKMITLRDYQNDYQRIETVISSVVRQSNLPIFDDDEEDDDDHE